MKRSSRGRRVLARVATVATSVAVAATAAGTAVADSPAASRSAKNSAVGAVAAGAHKPTPAAPSYFLSGILPSGQMYVYMTDGKGGFEARSGAYVWKHFKYGASIDLEMTGSQDGGYHVMDDGTLNLWRHGELKRVGGGWSPYDSVFVPGALGGVKHPDLLARDKQGVLWRWQTRMDGSLAPRTQIGGGWNQYSQITGVGDLTGDTKPDIVARDKQGVLWLYKGTGDLRKPFAPRVRIGGGWNQFNKLVATGDVDGDGHSDLIARDTRGDLYLYKGTGNAAAPFRAKAKIGYGFQQYRDLF
ncbi:MULTISPECIES: VCBS repeat-containing protein [unclassified Streptomyces]|uniref:VCBS repeat-containing protein n=1 Tax=Streptomyces sp. NBC_00060 TaxID=2975636 RepID=A0AAU2HFA5_9ACTN